MLANGQGFSFTNIKELIIYKQLIKLTNITN